MNERFKFRCWIEGEFPKLVPNYDGEHTEYVYCDEAYGYYIYSDTISDGQIVTTLEDIEKACGLNEEDFDSYLDYLYEKFNVDEGYIWLDGILEQCTGAKDKNGKLIYEGDILEVMVPSFMAQNGKLIYKGDVEHGDCRYVVRWTETGCGFFGYTTMYELITLNAYFMENSIIIGNIHENPELLNGGRNE